MKKKILYLIFANSTTSGGGHFYSLQTVIKSLNNDITYKVINFGKKFVSVISDIENSSYVPIYKYNLLKHWQKLCETVEDFAPDCIHAFDQRSLYIGRAVSIKIGIPIVYTKCGGANGNRMVPYADSVILFSKENYIFYKKNRKFKNLIFHIPNRVIKIKLNNIRINKLRETYNINEEIVIMRISRFNPYYQTTMNQAYELFKRFKTANISTSLVLIGKIQNEDYINGLKEQYNENDSIKFVTEDVFTNNASELLGIADIVIGTGRGAMEAASTGRIVFCPNKNLRLPTLMTFETIEELLALNLSERYSGKEEKNLNVRELLQEKEIRSKETSAVFRKYFDIETVKSQYLEIYKSQHKGNKNLINFIFQSLWYFKPR